MREKYESLSLVVLRDLAKARGLKNISSMKKSDLVNRMLEEDARKQNKPNYGYISVSSTNKGDRKSTRLNSSHNA